MSRIDNHWYLLRSLADFFGHTSKQIFRLRTVVIWLVFVVFALTVLLPMLKANQLSPDDVQKILYVFIGAFVLWQVWRNYRLRSAYRRGLQHAGPSWLIETIGRNFPRNSPIPAADVLRAGTESIAFCLYGDEENAGLALSKVDWAAQAPTLQASGLLAEAFIEFLCRRNPTRGLELSRRARELSSLSPLIPGAGREARSYDTLVAIGEVLSGSGSAESLEKLAGRASSEGHVVMQLLASFAVVVGMTGAGRTDRAEQALSFIRKIAPHCAPLHCPPAAYAAAMPPQVGGSVGSVSSALVSSMPTSQKQAAKAAWIKLIPLPLFLLILFVLFSIWFRAAAPT